MATNGLLGKTNVVTPNQWTSVYTVPTAGVSFATGTIMVCNRSITETKIRLAIGTAAVPDNVDYIEYDALVPANGGVLERTCLPMTAGETVRVMSTQSGVTVQVRGLEQAA